MNFNELAKQIHLNNAEKGFWDNNRPLTEVVMLTVCELSEAIEADRKGNWCTEDEKSHYLENPYDGVFELNIKDTVQDEIADAMIRLLDLAAAFKIDIDFHIEAKLKYNKTRPNKHGKSY